MGPPYARIVADPCCYLFELDPDGGQGAVLHVDAEFFRGASFLDQRAVTTRRYGGWRVEVAGLGESLAQARRQDPPAHFLFHVGHCGSTLLSRVLDGLVGVHGLREPLPLLGLAHRRYAALAKGVPADPRGAALLDLAMALLERPLAGCTRTVIKPTSRVSVLAGDLLRRRAGARAVFLSIDLPDFIAAHLRDADLCATAIAAAAERRVEWRAAGGIDPWPDLAPAATPAAASEALAWLWWRERARVTELRRDRALAERILEVDFADWLADPPAVTARVAGHFGLPDEPSAIARAIAAAAPDRYAKDPAQAFDATRRRSELAAVRERHAAEIAEAMARAEVWTRES